MQAKKISDARIIPWNEHLPSLLRCHHAQIAETGRNDNSTGLFNAAMAQRSPKQTQGIKPSFSSISSVSKKIRARSRAERLVSHTHRVHQYIT